MSASHPCKNSSLRMSCLLRPERRRGRDKGNSAALDAIEEGPVILAYACNVVPMMGTTSRFPRAA